jgi:hypothetical protein
MQFNFRPAKGWRAFAGEVGVIVLGVLIALGAQQAAETVNERREAAETRATLTNEIGSQALCSSRRWETSQGSAVHALQWRSLGQEQLESANRCGRQGGKTAAECNCLHAASQHDY